MHALAMLTGIFMGGFIFWKGISAPPPPPEVLFRSPIVEPFRKAVKTGLKVLGFRDPDDDNWP